VDAVIRLLRAGLDAQLSPEIWRRLFEYPGAANQPNLGFVLESGDRLVGFLGAIYSERLLNGRIERFCNLSSWYTVPEFRSSSLTLMMALLSQRGYTFTTLTPSPVTAKVLTAFGFRRLETDKVVFGPRLFRNLLARKIKAPRGGSFYRARRALEILSETAVLKGLDLLRGSERSIHCRGLRMFAGADRVGPNLAAADQKILEDHPHCGHFLVHHENSYSYAVTTSRRLEFGRRSLTDFVVTEILHLSSANMTHRHWEFLCELILRHDGSLSVMVDGRLIGPSYANGLRIPYYSYFMGNSGLNPSEIDSLYTEIPLLELSFYV
jgi:hypothetical protein